MADSGVNSHYLHSAGGALDGASPPGPLCFSVGNPCGCCRILLLRAKPSSGES